MEKTTRRVQPNLVESVSAEESRSFSALIDSINNLNKLPLNIKRKLTYRLRLKDLDRNNITFNFLHNLICNYSFNNKEKNPFKELFNHVNIFRFMLHQVTFVDDIYDIPEIKAFYTTLFPQLGLQLSLDEYSVEFNKYLKYQNELKTESIELKNSIINNDHYKKLFVGDSIAYIKEEFLNSYSTSFLKVQLELIRSNIHLRYFYDLPRQLVNGYNFKGLTHEDLLYQRKYDQPIRKGAAVDALVDAHISTLNSYYKDVKKDKITNSLDYEKITNSLKSLYDLNVYLVDIDFYEDKYVKDLDDLFSLLLIHQLIEDSELQIGLGRLKDRLIDISLEVESKVTFKVDETKKSSLNLTINYNPENPLPEVKFYGNNIDFKTFRESKLRFTDTQVLKNLIINQRNGKYNSFNRTVFGFPLFNFKVKTDQGEILTINHQTFYENLYYDGVSALCTSLYLGELEIFNKILLEFSQMPGFSHLNKSTLYINVIPVATTLNGIGPTPLLVKINLIEFIGTIKFMLQKLPRLADTLSFIDKVSKLIPQIEDLSFKTEFIYAIYRSSSKNALGCSIRFGENLGSSSSAKRNFYKSDIGELKMKDPQDSIKAFGNSSIKQMIYKDYLDSVDKEEFFRDLFAVITINEEKNYKDAYTTETLVSKGYTAPLKVVSVAYGSSRYKFVLTDFYIEINENLACMIDLKDEGEDKKTKKTILTALKSILIPVYAIPKSCELTDKLLFIERVNNLSLTYKSGKKNTDIFVKVKNLTTNQIFTTNILNLKPDEKKISKKRPLKN